MKKYIYKFICFVCVLSLSLSSVQILSYADNGKFVNLSICGFNDEGLENIEEDNVFYVKNQTLYAPIKTLEAYTMYDYDDENNAFVRTGQEFKKSNSKVIVDYNNKLINVFYSDLHKETYDIDIFSFADTYFLPLEKMAAYLKASVIYRDSNTISIVSSGISVNDALYDFSIYTSSLNAVEICDDLFVGNQDLYAAYMFLGYMGNTIFSFKISNLFTTVGDYEKYCTIMDKAVTNTSVYESLIDNKSGLLDLMDNVDDLYDNVYKKANKIYKLGSNSIITMFNEHKMINSFGDESPFDNFFPEEQLEIDKINAFSDKVKTVSQFLEIADYLHKFYTINDDNRDALRTVFNNAENDSRGLAIKKTRSKYSDSLIESAYTQISEKVLEECIKEVAKSASDKIFSTANKVKLATSIVNTLFKTFGFDLSDNSSYEVLIASELSYYLINNSDIIDSKIYNTINDSEKMRLTAIMILLVDIEGYKLGNKVAKRIDKNDSNHYENIIEEYQKRLTLLYLAKDSKNYDSIDGTNKIIEQNQKQLSKYNITELKPITNQEAEYLLLDSADDIELMNKQISSNYETYTDEQGYEHNLPVWVTSEYTYKSGTYEENQLEGKVEQIEYFNSYTSSVETMEYRHSCIKKINNTTGEEEFIIRDDYNCGFVVNDGYIYYVSDVVKYNDVSGDLSAGGIDYIRTDLNGNNREILYHDDYIPHGSGIGWPPVFLLSNEYLYISKYSIERINLKTKEIDTIYNPENNSLFEGQRWINLNFVVDDNYYFSLTDNGSEYDTHILCAYFCYNKNKDKLETVFSVIENTFWVDNGDGTKILERNSDYTITKAGYNDEVIKGTDYKGSFLEYRKNTPFSKTGIYFIDRNSEDIWFYSFSKQYLDKVNIKNK